MPHNKKNKFIFVDEENDYIYNAANRHCECEHKYKLFDSIIYAIQQNTR